MKLPSEAVTLDDFSALIDLYQKNECEMHDGHFTHKLCGGAIRVGFVHLFLLNDDGSLDSGPDGFGIGPKRVPYCERCDPPDGLNHTYACRILILKGGNH